MHNIQILRQNPERVLDSLKQGKIEKMELAVQALEKLEQRVLGASAPRAESLHSWLRPYFQMHRGIPDWLTPLLQFYWNHHTFQRGKRKGKNPLGGATTWSEALDGLLPKPVMESNAA